MISNATKSLRETHNEPEGLKRRARQGSIRSLRTEDAVAKAWDYIVNGQGAPWLSTLTPESRDNEPNAAPHAPSPFPTFHRGPAQ